MTPIQINTCNDVLRAPAGDANCRDLHIMLAENATATDGRRAFDAAGWMNECLTAERDVREMQRCLAINRENIISAIEEVIDKALNPNPHRPDDAG